MFEFLMTGAIGSLLIVICCLNLYEVLRLLWQRLPSLTLPPRFRVLAVVGASFLVHIMNIWLFGFVYYALVYWLRIGAFGGATHEAAAPDFFGCLYFSATTYSTVGFGDLTPQGGLRMIAGVESLTGFLLIGWTVSFTFLAMEKFWLNHRIAGTKSKIRNQKERDGRS